MYGSTRQGASLFSPYQLTNPYQKNSSTSPNHTVQLFANQYSPRQQQTVDSSSPPAMGQQEAAGAHAAVPQTEEGLPFNGTGKETDQGQSSYNSGEEARTLISQQRTAEQFIDEDQPPDNNGQSLGSSYPDGGQTLVSNGLLQLVLVAAATAASLGYDVGIMAAAIMPLETDMHLNSVQKELAMGSLNFVAAAGALLGGRVANAQGRKPTVRVCAWLYVVGTVLMSITPNYWGLLFGRIITGLGVGVSFVVAPVYLSEVAPTHLRGQLNTVFDVAINGGILLGYAIGFLVEIAFSGVGTNEDVSPFVNSLKWRVMLAIGLVLPIVVLANLNALPESPRWLVMRDMTGDAEQVLSGLGENPRQILRTVSSIQDELQNESGEVISFFQWSSGMRRKCGLVLSLPIAHSKSLYLMTYFCVLFHQQWRLH
jgi:MFS family permease